MPATEVWFFQDSDGAVPVMEWLGKLQKSNVRAYQKCLAAIARLAADGHELRRPTADHVRDGVYELRAKDGRVNYRILYFFHGRGVAILAHGFTKEKELPKADVDRAMARKALLEANPRLHVFREEQ